MRRLLLVVVLLVAVPVALSAQTSGNAGEVAHGAEKDAHKELHKTENHGEGKDEPKTYFGIPGWILKLANMIAFLALLVYFLKGPVKTAFRTKGEQVRAAAAEAAARREKADQLAADIQARLTQIEKEVAAILQRAEQEGERQKRELIAAAETESAKILQSARIEVDNKIKLARHELTEFAGQLSADRAESILRASMTEADQQKLFRESLEEIGEART